MTNNFGFMGNPIVPGQPQQQYIPNQNIGYMAPQPQMYPVQMVPQQPQYPMIPNTPPPEQPLIKPEAKLSYGFTVVPDEEEETIDPKFLLKIPEENAEVIPPARKRGRPRKSESNQPIITGSENSNSQIEDPSAMYTYAQTTMMLHDTVGQLDMIASEIKSEMDDIRLSRTARNKYNTVIGLSTALGKILETKVSAISQINSAISKANELDYKREKDRKSIEANQMMDDKRIMDLYQSFVANPMGTEGAGTSVLGPSNMQTIVGGSQIIRSDTPTYAANNTGGVVDAGYLNYLSNATPEQNLMMYENNPNVQTCVIYDASTGNKFFQVMDISTGQAIPNVQALDNRFMEDTFIDLKTKTASNNNLHQTYPVIVINEDVVSQY